MRHLLSGFKSYFNLKTKIFFATKLFIVIAASLFSFGSYAQTPLEGKWEGKLEVAPNQSLIVHFTFTANADGTYSTVMNSPDEGAIKNLAADSTSFDGALLELEVTALAGSYKGTLKQGIIEGEWNQPGGAIKLNLAPYEEVTFSQETIDFLKGQWSGKLVIPAGGEFNLVLHFEINDTGKFVGFVQNADAGDNKTPMANLAYENGNLSFRVPQAGAEYKGKLEGDGFVGKLNQGGNDMTLNVKRGGYKAPVVELALTEDDMKVLQGSWKGKLGPLTLVFRFEKNADGLIVGFVDSPDQGAMGLRMSEASLVDGTVKFGLSMPPASYTGKLSDNSIEGNWTQNGQSNPITVAKQE